MNEFREEGSLCHDEEWQLADLILESLNARVEIKMKLKLK